MACTPPTPPPPPQPCCTAVCGGPRGAWAAPCGGGQGAGEAEPAGVRVLRGLRRPPRIGRTAGGRRAGRRQAAAAIHPCHAALDAFQCRHHALVVCEWHERAHEDVSKCRSADGVADGAAAPAGRARTPDAASRHHLPSASTFHVLLAARLIAQAMSQSGFKKEDLVETILQHGEPHWGRHCNVSRVSTKDDAPETRPGCQRLLQPLVPLPPPLLLPPLSPPCAWCSLQRRWPTRPSRRRPPSWSRTRWWPPPRTRARLPAATSPNFPAEAWAASLRHARLLARSPASWLLKAIAAAWVGAILLLQDEEAGGGWAGLHGAGAQERHSADVWPNCLPRRWLPMAEAGNWRPCCPAQPGVLALETAALSSGAAGSCARV